MDSRSSQPEETVVVTSVEPGPSHLPSRALVVDDSMVVADVVTALLRRTGWTVDVANTVDAALKQDQALREMRKIYEVAEAETGVALDFSDVPNVLCETDKFLRVLNGEGKPRALYVPGRGC